LPGHRPHREFSDRRLDDFGRALHGATPESVADEIVAAQGPNWSLPAIASRVRAPVLTIYATHGGAAGNRVTAEALRRAGCAGDGAGDRFRSSVCGSSDCVGDGGGAVVAGHLGRNEESSPASRSKVYNPSRGAQFGRRAIPALFQLGRGRFANESIF
jgi:hypothetical protein